MSGVEKAADRSAASHVGVRISVSEFRRQNAP
jgi:hypothetical protein